MAGEKGNLQYGNVKVTTTNNGGHPVEFWAEQLTDRICGNISENAPEHIRQQALAYKGAIYRACEKFMRDAIMSDRTTLAAMLRTQGHSDIANIIGRI